METILNNFENKVFNLTNEIKSQKVFSSAELLNDIFFELKEKSLSPTSSGLASGFYDLDSLKRFLGRYVPADIDRSGGVP